MEIAFLSSNHWRQPVLKGWLPVSYIPEDLIYGVPLGRKFPAGQYPVTLWLDPMPRDEPILHRSVFVNWGRQYVQDAFPNVTEGRGRVTDRVVLSKYESTTAPAGEDAVLLIFDLHSGKNQAANSPHGAINFQAPSFQRTLLIHHLQTYPIGVVEIQPGFVASFRLEKSVETFKVIYTKKDGVFIAPDVDLVETEPSSYSDIPLGVPGYAMTVYRRGHP